MKKTFLAFGAALILLAILLLLDRQRDAARSADHFIFDTTQKAGVNYVKVSLQHDTTVLLKTSGRWVVAPDSFPVDTAKMNKTLPEFLSLQSKEIVSSNPSRLEEYGLDSAQARLLEWRTNTRTIRVLLGKTSGADYGTTYWKWTDKPEVFSTPGNFVWDVSARSSDWKDRNLFKFNVLDLKTVQVDWRDSTDALYHYKLERVNDTLTRMLEPDSSTVIANQVTPILAECNQFNIDDFVAPGDSNLSKIGLETPRIVIRMELKDGKSYEIKGGRTFNSYVYVQHPFRNDIVKISTWRFDAFRKKPGALSGKDTLQTKPLPRGPHVAIKNH